MHFYCEKLYLWSETGNRELIDPLGLKIYNALRLNPYTFVNSHPD